MRNKARRGWRVGLTAMGTVAVAVLSVNMARPAAANPPNQSDITGTNVFNSVAPDFFDNFGDRLDPATLAEAERLSNRLDEAYQTCLNSAAAAESLPRRFARGAARPIAACTTPQCRQFEALLQETRQFLASVEATTVDLDQFLRDRIW
ncbi:MAG: hypothetical protein WBA57_00245 [Elainellaceae cyanobacterium]